MTWLLILGIVCLLAYEYWAIKRPEPGDTISEIVWKYSKRSRLFTFCCGLLGGHFFWCACR
jgi:hypothetical protein